MALSPTETIAAGFFTQATYGLFKQLVEQLAKLRHERQNEFDEIERVFGNLTHFVPYYVTPDAQNVNPADLDEDDTGLVARDNVFVLLSKFFSGSQRFSHAFVLSDAGMGKSTLLVMLKLCALNNFVADKYDIVLFKIGSDTLANVAAISNPQRTILLLDALDEDREAWTNFYSRLQSLLQGTHNFRKVIITCRTQFFPQQYEQDGRVPGQIILSGFHCSKLFLSPFTLSQVDEYLEKRFDSTDTRKAARLIVSKMESLKFRPMLLSYVDFLIDGHGSLEYSYALYESLVDEWLNRELRKKAVVDKKLLFDVSLVIAVHMYSSKEREIDPLALQDVYGPIRGVRELEDMSIEGRSLLHRTSAGKYKFAHYSILEYFVATSLAREPRNIRNSDQVIIFLGDLIQYRELRKLHGVDLHGVKLLNLVATSTDFSSASLAGGEFRVCNFKNSDFTDTDCTSAVFKEVDASHAVFTNTILDSFRCEASKLEQAAFTKCNAKKAHFDTTNFHQSIFKDSHFTESSFREAVFRRANMIDSSWRSCAFCKAQFQRTFGPETIFNECDFSEAEMEGSDWKSSRFKQCKFEKVLLSDSDVSNADFAGNHMNELIAERLLITGASFRNAQLNRSLLDYSKGNSANFSNIDATDSQWRYCELKQINFTKAQLNRSTFEKSTLAELDFKKANLKEARFNEASLIQCSFQEVEMNGVKFTSSRLDGCQFSQGVAEQANLVGARLFNCTFSKVELQNAIANEGEFSNVNFEDCDLSKATFLKARFESCSFKGSLLNGANFEAARLISCDLRDARYDGNTTWPEGTSPKELGAIGPGANLRGRQMNGANLSKVDLSNSILTGAIFSGAYFTDAKLVESDLTFCDFRKAKMSRVDLRGAKLEKADLCGADLNEAILKDATFGETKYDDETLFPRDFLPHKHGMIRIAGSGNLYNLRASGGGRSGQAKS